MQDVISDQCPRALDRAIGSPDADPEKVYLSVWLTGIIGEGAYSFLV